MKPLYMTIEKGDDGIFRARFDDRRVVPHACQARTARQAVKGLLASIAYYFERPPAPNPVPTDAEKVDTLNHAIAFALNEPDGMEWLRAWHEGEPEAMAELDGAEKRNL